MPDVYGDRRLSAARVANLIFLGSCIRSGCRGAAEHEFRFGITAATLCWRINRLKGAIVRNVWPRDQYSGPGGGMYAGPGGGMYAGPGGGMYAGPGGGMYAGPGGGMYAGPGGGMYAGPGGGLYTGPKGGLYTGPKGGLYEGPGGGLYAGPGGGMYAGPCSKPYRSNIPPWPIFVDLLRQYGYIDIVRLILAAKPPDIRW
jgi:hypothetical protein